MSYLQKIGKNWGVCEKWLKFMFLVKKCAKKFAKMVIFEKIGHFCEKMCKNERFCKKNMAKIECVAKIEVFQWKLVIFAKNFKNERFCEKKCAKIVLFEKIEHYSKKMSKNELFCKKISLK